LATWPLTTLRNFASVVPWQCRHAGLFVAPYEQVGCAAACLTGIFARRYEGRLSNSISPIYLNALDATNLVCDLIIAARAVGPAA